MIPNIWKTRTVILLITLAAAVVLAIRACVKRPEPIRMEVPAADTVTVCYYIADPDRPYEQVWYGGEKLEDVLADVAGMEFTEAKSEPDESAFRAALVIATNEEQITVHVDEDGRAWVYYEGRWVYETQTN